MTVTPILTVGDHIASNDPLPTPGEYLSGLALSSLGAGVMQGVAAHTQGGNFFNGNPRSSQIFNAQVESIYEGTKTSMLASGNTDDVLMEGIGNRQVNSYLTHYTNEKGYQAIMESGEILPSLGIKNARYGTGQYFTDINPTELTIGQTSRKLYGVPWNTSKLTHQITIDATNLNVIQNTPNNFLIPGQNPLNINGRIINSGPAIFKIKF